MSLENGLSKLFGGGKKKSRTPKTAAAKLAKARKLTAQAAKLKLSAKRTKRY